jgi:hypothetical protein
MISEKEFLAYGKIKEKARLLIFHSRTRPQDLLLISYIMHLKCHWNKKTRKKSDWRSGKVASQLTTRNSAMKRWSFRARKSSTRLNKTTDRPARKLALQGVRKSPNKAKCHCATGDRISNFFAVHWTSKTNSGCRLVPPY